MNPLMEQFVNEAKDILQGVSDSLMALEASPENKDLMNELFRLVHTLKGSSGIFEEFSFITKMLHKVEDIMDNVREGKIQFSTYITDAILEAMDIVSMVVDQLEESDGSFDPSFNKTAEEVTYSLSSLLENKEEYRDDSHVQESGEKEQLETYLREIAGLIPEDTKRKISEKGDFVFIAYRPEPECFYKGDDPFLLIKTVPGIVWGSVLPIESPDISQNIDIYRCMIGFDAISLASLEEVSEHLQYVSDQVKIGLFPALESCSLSAKDTAFEVPKEVFEILNAQKEVLRSASGECFKGKVQAASNVISNVLMVLDREDLLGEVDKALNQVLNNNDTAPLLHLVEQIMTQTQVKKEKAEQVLSKQEPREEKEEKKKEQPVVSVPDVHSKIKTLKVDTAKVDRLMNLVAEIVVAKNSLLYLAKKAEEIYGARELSREIKNKYSTFDRIVEEMQDAVSEIRMMPVSVIFQRLPRLVRDISKKLGKKVNLRLIGEETEADKNVIESLSEPLVHLVRNSLDHGIEPPEERRQKGKPEIGNLTISAYQEADQVIIEVADDGRGIDPEAVKLKAYKKGLIDEEALERIDDQKALDLIFLPGFSTAESISEISGRGVGMDVVKNTLEKLGGSVSIETELEKGTKVKLHLPLSMAVTKVMIIESANQTFGVPMDTIVESVRVSKDSIKKIKHQDAALLRGQIIPLYSLNKILGIPQEQISNEDGELAVLVLRIGRARVGLVVDAFKGTMDVILKPFQGVLASMSYYSGSAILGDGSVLIVLNPKEFWHVS